MIMFSLYCFVSGRSINAISRLLKPFLKNLFVSNKLKKMFLFIVLGILEVIHCVLVESPEALNIIKEEHITSIISLLDKHGRNHKVPLLICMHIKISGCCWCFKEGKHIFDIKIKFVHSFAKQMPMNAAACLWTSLTRSVNEWPGLS